jgi:hypothetical protein
MDFKVFNGIHWCSLVFIGVHWCSLVFIGVHWCSLVFIGVHWCSNDFTNFNGFQVKKSLKSTFGVQYIPLEYFSYISAAVGFSIQDQIWNGH